MADPAAPLLDRLVDALFRMEEGGAGGTDAEAMVPLRRSLERTTARLEAGGDAAGALFRLQVTGGKALIFQGTEALPLEPSRLIQLLNSIGLELKPGEGLDLDGALAAWIIRPEANLIESNLRVADSSVRTLNLKTGRDRDHVAAQAAETQKVRLRSRFTLLVGALQAAQNETKPEA
jgi:hypothetical protein